MAENDDLDLEDLEKSAAAEAPAAAAPKAPAHAPEAAGESRTAADLETVFDIPVNVSAVLGKSSLPVSELLKLAPGAVVQLDRKVGEAIDIYVNNRLVARGEVVVVEDRLGVTMTEIIKGGAN
jgi:flagellar motor switch protein FliN/FliY